MLACENVNFAIVPYKGLLSKMYIVGRAIYTIITQTTSF